MKITHLLQPIHTEELRLMNSARINILDWKASARIKCGFLVVYQTSLKLMAELHRPKLLSYSI